MHEDVSGPLHVPVEAVVVGGDLAVVVDVPGGVGRQPAGRRFQVGVDGPGQHLKKTHLCTNAIMIQGVPFVGYSLDIIVHLHAVVQKMHYGV